MIYTCVVNIIAVHISSIMKGYYWRAN